MGKLLELVLDRLAAPMLNSLRSAFSAHERELATRELLTSHEMRLAALAEEVEAIGERIGSLDGDRLISSIDRLTQRFDDLEQRIFDLARDC